MPPPHATAPPRIALLPPPLAAAASGDAAVAAPAAALALVLASALASDARNVHVYVHSTFFNVEDDGRGADAGALASLAAPALGGARGDPWSALASLSCTRDVTITSRARGSFTTHAVDLRGGRAVGAARLVPPPGRLAPGTRVTVEVEGGVDEDVVQSFTHATLHHALARPDARFTLTLHTRGGGPGDVAVAGGDQTAVAAAALGVPPADLRSAVATSAGVTAAVVAPPPFVEVRDPRVWVVVDGRVVASPDVAGLVSGMLVELMKHRDPGPRAAPAPAPAAAVCLTLPPGGAVLLPGASDPDAASLAWTPPRASFAAPRAVAAAVRAALARAWHDVAPAAWLPDPLMRGNDAVISTAPPSPPRRRKHRSAPARTAAPPSLPLTLPPAPPPLTLADLGVGDPLAGATAPFPGAATLASAVAWGQLVDPATQRSTFCVARTRGGDVLLIDPHAAHERVRLEQLTAAVLAAVDGGRDTDPTAASLTSAALTPPIPLTAATPADAAALTRYSDACTAWGWRWTGTAPPRVTRVPVVAGARLPASSLLDFARALAASAGGARVPAAVTSALASRACRGAVMFGAPLPRTRVAAVAGALSLSRAPAVCAHGRPTAALVVSGGDLQAALAARRGVRQREGGGRATGQALVAELLRKRERA